MPFGKIKFQKEFEERHQPFFQNWQQIQELFDLCEEHTKTFSNQTDHLLYYLFFQVWEDFNSTVLLLANSHYGNAMTILRSMYEHCVTMTYIKHLHDNPIKTKEEKPLPDNIDKHLHDNPIEPTEEKLFPDNIEKYSDFFYVNENKQLNKLKEIYADQEFPNESLIKRNFDNVKEKFLITDCKKCKTTRTNHSWSPNSIIAMAQKVNLDIKHTYFCYYMGLIESHPSANSFNSSWTKNSDGKISLKIQSENEERHILYHSYSLFLQSSSVLLNHFKVVDDKGIFNTNKEILKGILAEISK